METIEVRGVEYKLVKARDFEVIVRSDNGFINYTKLCQQINDNRRPFSQLKKSETFQRLCIQMENSSGRIRPEQLDASLYEQIKDRIEIEEGGRQQDPIIARISGTYMPRYLLDYVFKPEETLCCAAQRSNESKYIKDLMNKDRIEIDGSQTYFFKETLLCQLVLWNLPQKHLK